jgi:hypothetical protein
MVDDPSLPFPSERERVVLAIRSAVAAKRVYVVHRRRHRHLLANRGLGHVTIPDALLLLEHHDIRAGPEPDHHVPSREIWIFGPFIGDVEMYVKVALGRDAAGGEPVVVVWSFHPSRHPMSAVHDATHDDPERDQ